MKTSSITILIILAMFTLFSCDFNESDTDKIEITDLKVAPNTVSIKSMDSTASDWIEVEEKGKSYYLPLKWIEGFEYEVGFQYNLRVKKITPINPIQDAPQSFYYLIEILSKEKIE